MIYLYTILLGIVQGITEFLPISSSGHLVILRGFIELNLSDGLAFDVALHLGSFVALFIYFFKEIRLMVVAFFYNIFRGRSVSGVEQNMVWYLIVATIPAVIVGYFFEDIIEMYLRSVTVVVVTLIVGAILFLLAEKFTKRQADLWQIKWWQALLVGIMQVTALIPGVSRAGITIITGMSMKLKRVSAAKFSFLMAIPVILGAGIKKSIDVFSVGLKADELTIFAIGFLVSLIVSYLAVRWLIRFLQKNSLHVFAYYRIALAILIIAVIYFGGM